MSPQQKESQVANVTEQALEAKRDKIAKLREDIAKEESAQSVVASVAARNQEAAVLDEEIARLEAELEARKVSTKSLTESTEVSARSAMRAANAEAKATAEADDKNQEG